MANCADYCMRVRGDYQTVVRFFHLLYGNGPTVVVDNHETPDWFGRTGHGDARVCILHNVDLANGNISDSVDAEICDYSAWSIGSVVEGFGSTRHSIKEFCDVYGMQMEVFCREDGEGFSEYYYANGTGGLETYDFDHDDITKNLKRDADGFWNDDEFEEAYKKAFPWKFRRINNIVFDNNKAKFTLLTELALKTDPDWEHDDNYRKLTVIKE